MPRKKEYYNYWQLPDWNMDLIIVTRRFVHNGKSHITLRDGDNIYKIKVPKKPEWNKVRENDMLVLTKHKIQEKNARLEINAIE